FSSGSATEGRIGYAGAVPDAFLRSPLFLFSGMPSELIRKAKVASLAGSGEATPVPVDEGVCDPCGDSLAGLKVVQPQIGATLRPYCCNGCAFIAEQLFLAQAGARDRQALNAALTPGADAAVAKGPVVSGTQTRIEVRGMVCAACGLLIEHRLRRLAGVSQAHVDFTGRRAFVTFDDKLVTRDDLLREIRRAGYETGAGIREERRSARLELLRVLIAGLMMMQVMMLAVPLYFAAPGEIAPDIEQLLRIRGPILAGPVIMFCAQPLYRAAWSQLRIGTIGMDVPVVIGIGAAFIASTVATLFRPGRVFFVSTR